jgi:hypothetical protein
MPRNTIILALWIACAVLLAACGPGSEQIIQSTQTAEPAALRAALAAQSGVVRVTSVSVFTVSDGSSSVGATIVIDDSATPETIGAALMNAANPLIMGNELRYSLTLQQSTQETNFLGTTLRREDGATSSSYEAFTRPYPETPTPKVN